MAQATKPSRNIPRDHTTDLVGMHLAKKATGGPLPFYPANPPVNKTITSPSGCLEI
jgi:hypothetical protein